MLGQFNRMHVKNACLQMVAQSVIPIFYENFKKIKIKKNDLIAKNK